MTTSVFQLQPRRTGTEHLHRGLRLLDFWRWCYSDLLTNTSRGALAEFLVASALKIPLASRIRNPWAAYDLKTKYGAKVQVKSSAYVQSWDEITQRKKPRTLIFNVEKTEAWDPETDKIPTRPCRQSNVYVFAVLAHQDPHTIDPLDPNQWDFYVLSRRQLDRRERSQHSITINSLTKIKGAGPMSFSQLAAAVRKAFNGSRRTKSVKRV